MSNFKGMVRMAEIEPHINNQFLKIFHMRWASRWQNVALVSKRSLLDPRFNGPPGNQRHNFPTEMGGLDGFPTSLSCLSRFASMPFQGLGIWAVGYGGYPLGND